jgi:gliding motility-associated-like protein
VRINVSSVDTSVTYTRPTSFCAGDSTVLRAAINTSYQWMLNGVNIPGANAQNYTATQSGSYRVKLSNAQSCVDTSRSISVTVNPLPAVPTVTSPVVYCQNATASALQATGTNLLWYSTASGGTGSATTPTPSTTTAGNTGYYVNQTVNGCTSSRALINVTINPLPAAPTVTTPVQYCQDATASQLTATGTSLLWYTTATGGIGNATAPSPITIASGNTTYYVSQNDGNCEGPRASIVVTVSPFSAPPIVSSPVVYCQNATASALTAIGTSLFWYDNSTGGIGDPNAPTPETTISGNTTYYVGQTSVGSCPGSRAEIVVIVNPAPENAPTVTTPVHFCQGTTATPLTASGSGLLWFTVASGGSGSSSAPTPSTASAINTTYYVCESIGTCEGPRAALVVSIDPAGVPVFDPINSICIGGTTPTLQTVSLNGIPGFWTPSTISNTITQLHTFTPTLGAGTCAATTTMLISVFPNPYKNTRFTSINALQGRDMQLQARKVDSPAVYLWTPGAGLNNINIANPIYNFGREVEYTINITTKEGCKVTDTLLVRIFKQVEIYVPSGFSPNGDGKNDVLIPEPVGIKEFHYFKVFDRWGQLVYQTSERGKGWNGFFKGQKQPMETYMWIAEGVDIYGKIVKRSGSTILLK